MSVTAPPSMFGKKYSFEKIEYTPLAVSVIAIASSTFNYGVKLIS
jgi:hypothetical protein